MRRIFSLTVISLCFLAAAGASGAQRDWERLGAREVDFRNDRDRIDVGKSEGRFKELQIRAQGAPIEITEMVVTFGNDEKFTPKFRHRFAEGTGSRTIDLPGERRTIKRIDFNYHTIKRREGKGRIEVYAR